MGIASSYMRHNEVVNPKRDVAPAPAPTSSRWNRRADVIAYGYACAYGVAALVAGFRAPPIGDLTFDTDFYGDLVLAAQALARGHFAVENYPYKGPLYSFVLIAAHAIDHDWFRAATIVSALS